jgi:hypothetical protein
MPGEGTDRNDPNPADDVPGFAAEELEECHDW